MRTTPFFLSAAMITALLSPSAAGAADSLPITPGLWELTTRGTMMGQSHEAADEQCMVDDRFDPTALMAETDGCRAENVAVDGNTISFDQVCMQGDGEASGHLSFTIEDETGRGEGTMTMSMNGENVEITYVMTAKRLGDC